LYQTVTVRRLLAFFIFRHFFVLFLFCELFFYKLKLFLHSLLFYKFFVLLYYKQHKHLIMSLLLKELGRCLYKVR